MTRDEMDASIRVALGEPPDANIPLTMLIRRRAIFIAGMRAAADQFADRNEHYVAQELADAINRAARMMEIANHG